MGFIEARGGATLEVVAPLLEGSKLQLTTKNGGKGK